MINMTLEVKAALLITDAKKRAKLKNIKCDITYEWIIKQIEKQNNKCLLSNKEFILSAGSPWAPSLDRINPSKGYTKNNCRIVAWCVNVAMNNWGDKIFKEMCEGVVNNCK